MGRLWSGEHERNGGWEGAGEERAGEEKMRIERRSLEEAEEKEAFRGSRAGIVGVGGGDGKDKGRSQDRKEA